MIVFTVLYFAAAYLISLNPSKILDRIGRILTPVFAILIVILVVLGALKYGGTSPQAASAAYKASAFGTGFLEGYNTFGRPCLSCLQCNRSSNLETTWIFK